MKKLITILLIFMAASLSAQNLTVLKDKDTDKVGFVDVKGEWVIRPIFDDCQSYSSLRGCAIVQYKRGWGAIDKKGTFVIKPVFTYQQVHYAAQEWAEQASLGRSLYLVQDKDTEKWGYTNYLGNWAIKPIFEECHPWGFGSELKDYGSAKYQGAYGVINKKGEFVTKVIYDYGGGYRAAGAMQSQNSGAVPASQVPNFNDIPTSNHTFASLNGTPTQPDHANVAQNKSPAPTAPSPQAQGIPHTPPTINILSPKNGSNYETENITVRYEAKAADGSAPEILIFIDGEPYDVKTKGVRRAYNEVDIRLPRKQDITRLQLIASDAQGYTSLPAVISLNYTGDKPKPVLHVLSVGVGQYNDPNIRNLDHAAKDAVDMVNTITGINKSAYSRIEKAVLLTDGQATAINVKTELNNMVDRVSQDDVILLYFSGHGAKERNSTYFLTSDAKKGNLYATAVNFDEIKSLMRAMIDERCKVLVFMDACHAGDLFSTKALNETLQFAEPGAITYCSSTSNQKSVEDEKWENGVFTRALIDGLKGKARDEDGNITTVKLDSYIKETVNRETKGIQSPIVENKIGDFILF